MDQRTSDEELNQDKQRRAYIIRAILSIAAVGALVAVVAVAPGILLLAKDLLPKDHLGSRSVGRSLRNAERRGYVKRQRRGKFVELTLTPRGRERFDRFLLDDLTLPKPDPARWDGKWRIVLFDVPEQRRSLRTVFRTKLQSLGFSYVQRSAWLYPFPCERELHELADRLEIQDAIAVAATDSFSLAPKFLRRYKLSPTR